MGKAHHHSLGVWVENEEGILQTCWEKPFATFYEALEHIEEELAEVMPSLREGEIAKVSILLYGHEQGYYETDGKEIWT